MTIFIDKGVLYSWLLAKYFAAFLEYRVPPSHAVVQL